MPTPSRRVRLLRQAGLPTRRDDVADSKFFGYNSDDEGEGEAPPHLERERELGWLVLCRLQDAFMSNRTSTQIIDTLHFFEIVADDRLLYA
jgi:hypothetical protein